MFWFWLVTAGLVLVPVSLVFLLGLFKLELNPFYDLKMKKEVCAIGLVGFLVKEALASNVFSPHQVKNIGEKCLGLELRLKRIRRTVFLAVFNGPELSDRILLLVFSVLPILNVVSFICSSFRSKSDSSFRNHVLQANFAGITVKEYRRFWSESEAIKFAMEDNELKTLLSELGFTEEELLRRFAIQDSLSVLAESVSKSSSSVPGYPNFRVGYY